MIATFDFFETAGTAGLFVLLAWGFRAMASELNRNRRLREERRDQESKP